MSSANDKNGNSLPEAQQYLNCKVIRPVDEMQPYHISSYIYPDNIWLEQDIFLCNDRESCCHNYTEVARKYRG